MNAEMKKFLLAGGMIAAIALCGCQQIQEQAQNLRKQGETTINGLTAEGEKLKNQALETTAKIQEKTQQLQNAVDAVNKLTK